jgi:signal transduction histidine kinase
MHDLSLFLLDIVENSLRAGARTVTTRIEVDEAGDRLTIVVEDDGHGLPVTPEQALDPFYTTKKGKRTGLGLSLFREAVEAADGSLTVDDAPALGGVRVTAAMGLRHVDRPPLGDVVTTVVVMAVTNPEVELRFEVASGGERLALAATGDLLSDGPARRDCERLLAPCRAGMAELT